jgi:hypothetical protein
MDSLRRISGTVIAATRAPAAAARTNGLSGELRDLRRWFASKARRV